MNLKNINCHKRFTTSCSNEPLMAVQLCNIFIDRSPLHCPPPPRHPPSSILITMECIYWALDPLGLCFKRCRVDFNWNQPAYEKINLLRRKVKIMLLLYLSYRCFLCTIANKTNVTTEGVYLPISKLIRF